jgi:hypothetical protein
MQQKKSLTIAKVGNGPIDPPKKVFLSRNETGIIYTRLSRVHDLHNAAPLVEQAQQGLAIITPDN